MFQRSELLYDVNNYAYVEGDILESEDEHRKHQIFDIGQDGNIDRVTRVLNLAHSECVEMLYPYTKKEICDRCEFHDNELTEPEEYIIVLRVPQGFSSSTIMLLKHLIHEYLVCKVLADWLSITNTPKAQVWEQKAMVSKEEIRNNILTRISPVRCRLHPF